MLQGPWVLCTPSLIHPWRRGGDAHCWLMVRGCVSSSCRAWLVGLGDRQTGRQRRGQMPSLLSAARASGGVLGWV